MIKTPVSILSKYRPNYNLIFSGSVRQKDEFDYNELRQFLTLNKISLGSYLVDSYRELDQLSFSKR